MLIKIVIDTWRDIFDFLHPKDRRQLAQKFNVLGDREFSDICQLWLHEWTKNVRLGIIFIHHRSEAAHLQCYNPDTGQWLFAPFADVPKPANIMDFRRIRFDFMDTTVLQFAHQIQPIFHNGVYLRVFCDQKTLEASRIAICHLIPFLSGGIETFYINSIELIFTVRERFPAQFFGVKTIALHMERHTITDNLVELLSHWLGSRREDGEPRMLKFQRFGGELLRLVDTILQHFVNSAGSVSFYIRIQIKWELYIVGAVQESTTQNSATNEQLLVRKPNASTLLIGRCSSELDGPKWMEEMGKKMEEEEAPLRMRMIYIDFPNSNYRRN